MEEEKQQQIVQQDQKIENLENTIKSMQTNLEKRDKEWEDATMKAMKEMAEKFSDPEYIKTLQEKHN